VTPTRPPPPPIAEPYLTAESRQIPDFGHVQLGADEYFVLGDNSDTSAP
jgi:hypothetical protein